MPVEKWVEEQRAALREERDEERTEVTTALAQLSPLECQAKGLSLLHLNIIGTSTGLYGRTCITLGPSAALRRDGTLPAHGFSGGDEVVLTSMKGLATGGGGPKPQITGVVTRASNTRVDFVASSEDIDEELLDSWSSGGGPGLRLDMLASEATHKKMMEALDALEAYRDGPALHLINLVFGRIPDPSIPKIPATYPALISGAALNEDQQAAIALALATEDVALIHGPPGTGKTTAVVELILQAVNQGLRLLVCAPSNVAVDNIIERIAAVGTGTTYGNKPGKASNPRIVRLGHPARLSPQILRYSLEALIEAADGTEIVKDIRGELAGLEKKMPRDKGERRVWRGELKTLRKEIRNREEQVVKQILRSRDIVLCTNVGAATRVLKEEEFDLVVIDEAAQALEASCWIPILKGHRVVLAGDHKQLAPTIKSTKADKMGLGITLFDRLMEQLGETHSRMLTIQYRMNHLICQWASDAMYAGALKPADSVAHRTLPQLPHVTNAEDLTEVVLLLVDTAGCGMEEEEGEREGDAAAPPSEEEGKGLPMKKKKVKARGLLTASRCNQGEALVVEVHVRALLLAGLKQEDIAVITPYNAQVELLRSLLSHDFPLLEIRSVDGFQGGEREAVVMSLVRSNPTREVGFLADDRRLNVAITRAKRHCAVVADSETVSSHPFLAGLMKYCEENGELRSALEYLPDWVGAGGGEGGNSASSKEEKGGNKKQKELRSGAAVKKKQPSKAPEHQQSGLISSVGSTIKKGGQGEKEEAVDGGSGSYGGEKKTYDDSPISDNDLVAQVLRFVMAPPHPSRPDRVDLPAEISGRQRKLVHELVDGLNAKGIRHESQGIGKKRRLVLERLVVNKEDEGQKSDKEDEEASPLAAPASIDVQQQQQQQQGKGKSSKKASQTRQQQQQQSSSASQEEPLPSFPQKEQPTLGTAASSLAEAAVGGAGGIMGGMRKKPVVPLKGNSVLGSLHQERLARQQQQQQLEEKGDEEGEGRGGGEAGAGGGGVEGKAQGKGKSKNKKGGSGKGKKDENEDDEGKDADQLEMEALEEAIRANTTLKDLPHPPSEVTKARLYGWDRHPDRKGLSAKLGAKLSESQDKRKPDNKKDKKSK